MKRNLTALAAIVLAHCASVYAVEPVTVERLGPEAARAISRFYDYDATIPLEARTVERIERDGTVREKVVFRGVQGFLVPGCLE